MIQATLLPSGISILDGCPCNAKITNDLNDASYLIVYVVNTLQNWDLRWMIAEKEIST